MHDEIFATLGRAPVCENAVYTLSHTYKYTLKAEKPRPVDQMFAFSCLLDISTPSDGVAADA